MTVREIKKPINGNIVSMLEDMLAKAKSGDIQCLAIAGTDNECCGFNVFDGDYVPLHLIGELRVLEREIVDLCVDTRRKPAWEFCE
jgi:hypothetical protein